MFLSHLIVQHEIHLTKGIYAFYIPLFADELCCEYLQATQSSMLIWRLNCTSPVAFVQSYFRTPASLEQFYSQNHGDGGNMVSAFRLLKYHVIFLFRIKYVKRCFPVDLLMVLFCDAVSVRFLSPARPNFQHIYVYFENKCINHFLD